ncbi:MAG: hypothetical protein QF587_03100 [Candidatus Marinimicrobia bacterium]|nr:hypothetical protein [Candidatus Neomarinimicrobiota bacterium]
MKIKLRKRQFRSDLLELFIVLTFIFMVITIYVPRAIWEEEAQAEDQSRFYIQNIFDVVSFYNTLTDSFNVDGLWTINLINAVRDSVMADSTYLGERVLFVDGRDVEVNIPTGFDVDYDTTFGFPKVRRDTIVDTTLTIVMFLEELGRNDTLFIQHKKFAEYVEKPNFVAKIASESKERSELTNYYDSYQPNEAMLHCPLTNELYKIDVADDKNSVRVASPITDLYKESRYLIFSFKAHNHGYINDGIRSWD